MDGAGGMFMSNWLDAIKKNPKLSDPYNTGLMSGYSSAMNKIQGQEELPGRTLGPSALTSQANASAGPSSAFAPNDWNNFFNKNILDMMGGSSSPTADILSGAGAVKDAASNPWGDIFGSLSQGVGTAALSAGAQTAGRMLGGKTGQNIAATAIPVGAAAAQGFANPASDAAALMALLKLGFNLFG